MSPADSLGFAVLVARSLSRHIAIGRRQHPRVRWPCHPQLHPQERHHAQLLRQRGLSADLLVQER